MAWRGGGWWWCRTEKKNDEWKDECAIRTRIRQDAGSVYRAVMTPFHARPSLVMDGGDARKYLAGDDLGANELIFHAWMESLQYFSCN